MEKELFWGCLMAVSFMKMEEVAKIMGVPMEEVYKKVEEMMELLKLVSKVDCINLFFFSFFELDDGNSPTAISSSSGDWRLAKARVATRSEDADA